MSRKSWGNILLFAGIFIIICIVVLYVTYPGVPETVYSIPILTKMLMIVFLGIGIVFIIVGIFFKFTTRIVHDPNLPSEPRITRIW